MLKPKAFTIEPIRASAIILVVRLITMLFIFDVLYSFAFYLLNLQFSLPYDFHHHLSAAFLGINFIKVLVQVSFVVFIVLSWANNVYYLTGKLLIQRQGILHVHENVYDFSNIRTISIDQSLFGKIFNYGDITLKTSAPGGYQGDVTLVGIANPYKHEKILKECF